MMQTAESRLSDHATASHCWHSRIGSSLVQTEMCSIFMIVSYIIGEEPFQMSFVHGDNVIQEISPTAPDPSLCDSVGMSVQLRRMAMLKFDVSE
jgi:hypothetical protein